MPYALIIPSNETAPRLHVFMTGREMKILQAAKDERFFSEGDDEAAKRFSVCLLGPMAPKTYRDDHRRQIINVTGRKLSADGRWFVGERVETTAETVLGWLKAVG